MSPLEISLLVALGTGLAIYITVMLVRFFKKKKGKNKKNEDDE